MLTDLIPLTLTLPCNDLKPCSGTRELPVTNCRRRALCSSSYSSTTRQNQRTIFVSVEQCFNRVFRFQSSTSILPSPPIISCTLQKIQKQGFTITRNCFAVQIPVSQSKNRKHIGITEQSSILNSGNTILIF